MMGVDLASRLLSNCSDLELKRDAVWVSVRQSDSKGIPRHEGFLTASELKVAQTYRAARRYREFVGGRLLAKRAVLAAHRMAVAENSAAAELRRVEILADHPESESSRRVVRVDGIRQAGAVSISHADGWTAVGLTSDDQLGIGIDLVVIDPRNLVLQKLWLTSREGQLVDQSRNRALTLSALWTIKEALFKATARRSQRFIPREWETTVEGQTLRSYQAGVVVPAEIHLIRFLPNLVACLAFVKR